MPRARFINFTWNDNSCKILSLFLGSTTNACMDKHGVDCQMLDKYLGICKDPVTSNAYCKRHCGLCGPTTPSSSTSSPTSPSSVSTAVSTNLASTSTLRPSTTKSHAVTSSGPPSTAINPSSSPSSSSTKPLTTTSSAVSPKTTSSSGKSTGSSLVLTEPASIQVSTALGTLPSSFVGMFSLP